MNQKSYFTWTEDKKYTLAKLALRHEGYKPTDRAHQEKWENILEKLKMVPLQGRTDDNQDSAEKRALVL